MKYLRLCFVCITSICLFLNFGCLGSLGDYIIPNDAGIGVPKPASGASPGGIRENRRR